MASLMIRGRKIKVNLTSLQKTFNFVLRNPQGVTSQEICEGIGMSKSMVRKDLSALRRLQRVATTQTNGHIYKNWKDLSEERQHEIIIENFLAYKEKQISQKSNYTEAKMVDQVLVDLGCEIIKGYTTCRNWMEYKCSNGHIISTQPMNIIKKWRRGSKALYCKDCFFERKRVKEEKAIIETLTKIGYKLIGGYTSRRSSVTYMCDKGHVNKTSWFDPKRIGCKTCSESKGETAIRLFLQDKGIDFRKEWSFSKSSGISKKRFDFGITNPPCVIEYHGGQHYFPVSFNFKKNIEKEKLKQLKKNIKRDFEKYLWCEKHNVPLLIIPFWDHLRISEILDCFFNNQPLDFSEPTQNVLDHTGVRAKFRKELGINVPDYICGVLDAKKGKFPQFLESPDEIDDVKWGEKSVACEDIFHIEIDSNGQWVERI